MCILLVRYLNSFWCIYKNICMSLCVCVCDVYTFCDYSQQSLSTHTYTSNGNSLRCKDLKSLTLLCFIDACFSPILTRNSIRLFSWFFNSEFPFDICIMCRMPYTYKLFGHGIKHEIWNQTHWKRNFNGVNTQSVIIVCP